jgi:dihydrodipicolinate synthase/N-acetylneuraminate lyase
MPTLYDELTIPDFTVLIANADLNLVALSLGAVGNVSTIAVVIPELFVMMQNKLRAGELAGAAEEQRRVVSVARHLRTPAIGALHAGLQLRGVDAGSPRPPLRMPTDQEQKKIAAALQQAGVL